MDLQDLQELNKHRRKFTIFVMLSIICTIAFVLCFIFANRIPKVGLFIALLIIASLVSFIISMFALNKVDSSLLAYVLSQFPGWEKFRGIHDKKKKFMNELVARKVLFSTVFPEYHNKYREDDEPTYEAIFTNNENNLTKLITEVEYCEYERREHRNKKTGKTEDKYITTAQFNADIIIVKNTKNINSITYFQTNNYPEKTDKKIMEEKSKSELSKIELTNASENNIDVYGNNPLIAEKLATKELCFALQNIKEQFKSYYVKIVFYNDIIIVVLRHEDRFSGSFPLLIKIPWFKSIDYPLIEQAVNNFKMFTDIANQAPEFTKNI